MSYNSRTNTSKDEWETPSYFYPYYHKESDLNG